jgi:hypothetical protein
MEEKMDISDMQIAAYTVLINRFGSEVGMSMDLYNKVSNGTASPTENNDYIVKAEALQERVKTFYRQADVSNSDNLSDNDVDVLITMLNTGFAVTQNQTTHITKVLNNSKMESNLKDAKADNKTFVGGFIGAAEATEALSPQQQATTLGLDYESDGKTDFLLQTGTDATGKPIYEPIPQTCYMKLPYSDALKNETQMVLDPRLYERIKARSQTAGEPVASMAKDIVNSDICLTYKADPSATSEEINKKCDELQKKYGKEIRSQNPPYTGLGFSSFGEKAGTGFMNMYPEMYVKVPLNESNFNKYVGSGEVEFYAKFAKSDAALNTFLPQGSTDVLMGKWDGKKVTIPADAKAQYDSNLHRVKEKYSVDNQNKLMADKFSIGRVILHGVEERVSLPKPVEKHLKKHSDQILSNIKKISDQSRKTFDKRHKKKREMELFDNKASRLRRDAIKKRKASNQ